MSLEKSEQLVPTLTPELYRKLAQEVDEGMWANVRPCLTEIYFPKSVGSDVTENGTGTFVEIDGTVMLASCEHVIRKQGLEHSFSEHNYFISAARRRYTIPFPVDFGLSRVDPGSWRAHGAQANAINFSRFAHKHATVPGELLWMAGFPGDGVRHLSASCATAQRLCTQEYFPKENESPCDEFKREYHFLVYYSPEDSKAFQDKGYGHTGILNPPGLSGTLVWNTRRLECLLQDAHWSPEFAVVTGIVWGWPSSNYLIATRVEHFRDFVPEIAVLPST